MIITLNMDTEKDRDTCKKVLQLVLGFGGTVDLEVVGQPRAVKHLYKDVKDIWPTEDAEFKKRVDNEPTRKRRGRPPKVKKDIYTLAREKTAGMNIMSMMEKEYKSTKSRSTFVARGEKDRAYLVVTGEAATKAKVMKEVERVRIGGGTFFEVDALAKQMAATY